MGKLQLAFVGSFDKKIKLSDAHFANHIPGPETAILLVDQLLEKLSVFRKGLRKLSSCQIKRNLLRQILTLTKFFRENPLSRKYSQMAFRDSPVTESQTASCTISFIRDIARFKKKIRWWLRKVVVERECWSSCFWLMLADKNKF